MFCVLDPQWNYDHILQTCFLDIDDTIKEKPFSVCNNRVSDCFSSFDELLEYKRSSPCDLASCSWLSYLKSSSPLDGEFTRESITRIELKISNQCNFRCRWCANLALSTKPNPVTAELLLDKLPDLPNVHTLTMCGGEPYHDKVAQQVLIDVCKKRGWRSHVFSNMYAFDPLVEIDEVIVSVYGASRETVKAYTKVDAFDKVMANIEKAASVDKLRGINILLTPWSVNEDFSFLRQFGVNLFKIQATPLKLKSCS